jgi:transposase
MGVASRRRVSPGGSHLRVPDLFPHLAGLRIERTLVLDGVIHVEARRDMKTARCPSCGRRSRRVHSRYTRRITDEPLGVRHVVVHLRVRRFLCRNTTCPRRTFAEQAPVLAPRYARRSALLTGTLQHIGVALGGRPGARLSGSLRRPVSRTTLLRLVRGLPLPEAPPVRVLGVDDWARKRGCTYGTILIDQERHTVVDLLPERTATALAAWLRAHPGVEIIARDRAGAYADGARRGAPGATQVADRWHILVNLREALERLLARKHAAVRAAADEVLAVPSPAPPTADGPTLPVPGAADHTTRAHCDQQERRARRYQRFEAVQALHRQGVGVHQIARTLGIGRNTVRRFLRAEGFPERQPRRPGRTFLTPYEPYLRERWDAGCHNIAALWREVRARGYAGGYSALYAHLVRWRDQDGSTARSPSSSPRRFSVRQATWLLLRDPDELAPVERAYLDALGQRCPEADGAGRLARSFVTLVRDRDQTALAPWAEAAELSDLPELRGFAAGLRRDWAAVTAGLELPWSSGQTEGQVNRLKLLKRQMFGRAGFDLLRRRLLLAS